ncbi:hypothetical protein BDAP_002719 [Binucleata daphniae]
MQTIRDLILASKTNPAHLKQLETSIASLSSNIFEYQTLTYLFQDNNFECKFYGTIILQKRLKHVYKSNDTNAITAFVNFVNIAYEQIIGNNNINNNSNNNNSNNSILSNKMADIYALTIIYYYPIRNTNIFALINSAIQNNMLIGYLILQKFLFFLNTSSEISNDRRIELKKLCKENVTALLNECNNTNNIRTTIQIYTNALTYIKEKQLNMFDYVLQNGTHHKNETLDFLSEYTQLYCTEEQTNMIIEFAKNMNNDFRYKIIEILMQNKELCKNTNLLDFVLFHTKNEDFFDLCIEFFTKFYKNHTTNEKYAGFTFNVINTIKDYNIYDDKVCNKMEELIRIMSSKYTQVTQHLLTNFANEIPLNILVILLERCSLKKEFVFSNDFLNCYSEYKRSDASCVRYLQAINYDNKESIKFAIKIIKKYKVEEGIINYILNNVKNIGNVKQKNSINIVLLDDLMISCILTFLKHNTDNNEIDLVPYLSTPNNTNWDEGRKKIFLCFLKKDVKAAQAYFPSFFASLQQKTKENDITILAVIQKNYTTLPQEILVKLYNDLKIYETKELCVLINELLPLIPEKIAKPFIEQIYNKITMGDSDEVCVVKSYLNFIDREITKQINKLHLFSDMNDEYLIFYTNLLVESLSIKEHSVPRKIHEVIQKNSLSYNTANTIYKLLVLYNDSQMTDAQNDILAFLIYIIQKTDDLSVLLIVPQSTQQQIENLRISMQHGTTKNKKDVLREFLKEVKGKAMHEMFNDNVTVQKMGFTVQKKDESQNVNISDFFK